MNRDYGDYGAPEFDSFLEPIVGPYMIKHQQKHKNTTDVRGPQAQTGLQA